MLERTLEVSPRVALAHLPTPLEPLDRLSEMLGGPRIWVKRDDCTGLATGGNKTRKLEFLMAEALRHGATCVITEGATQSNHARQTAAACARLGLGCHILLEDRTGFQDPAYRLGGNVLLSRLHGATVSARPAGTDMASEMARFADRLRAQGARPYIIPGGGSNALGALGYVNCAAELSRQARETGTRLDGLVHATGSAGTQAGLLAGLCSIGSEMQLWGIGVRRARDRQEEKVHNLATATADLLGNGVVVPRAAVRATDSQIGPGYGQPTQAMCDALRQVARLEGLLLDPVYSGKAMAGLIELSRAGHFDGLHNIVFLHTGGSAALFGYPDTFDLPGYQA